jgi:hypothetical protein
MDCRDIYFSPKVKQEYYAGGNAYRKRLCEAGLTSNRDIIVIGGSAGATAPLKEIPSRIRSAGSGRGLHNPLQGVEILTKAASSAAPADCCGRADLCAPANSNGSRTQNVPAPRRQYWPCLLQDWHHNTCLDSACLDHPVEHARDPVMTILSKCRG